MIEAKICLTSAELREREQAWYRWGRHQERMEQNGRRIDEFRAGQEAERKLKGRAHS